MLADGQTRQGNSDQRRRRVVADRQRRTMGGRKSAKGSQLL